MNKWLIEESYYNGIKKKLEMSKSDIGELSAGTMWEALSADKEIMNISGGKATIKVEGVLTKFPSPVLRYFEVPNTAYSEMLKAIDSAENNDEVSEVLFYVNSPGGMVSGQFEVLDAMKQMKKPSRTVAGELIASAAYAIGATSGEIIAESFATRAGSVGVVIDGYYDENEYSITSTGAENKRPDPKTEEGKAEIVRMLDETADYFLKYIAEGRGIEQSKIMDQFGNGSVFYAENALKRGMIDKIERGWVKKVDKSQTNSNKNEQSNLNFNYTGPQTGHKQKGSEMNLETLKKEHPELVAQIEKEAVADLQDNISAHAHMAKESGAFEIALEAISAGEGLTKSYLAKYETAKWGKTELDKRKDDSVQTETSKVTEEEKALAEKEAKQREVAEKVAKARGFKLGEVK